MRRSPLRGRTVLVTGTLQHLKRGEAEAAMAALGATIAKGASRKVDLVVAGDNPGSKIGKAAGYGLRVVGEDWLRSVLAGADPDGPPRIDATVQDLDGDELTKWIGRTSFEGIHVPRDLRPVVNALHALEAREGVTATHRDASRKALAHVPFAIVHSRNHNGSIIGARLSPCGRYLATISNPPYGVVHDIDHRVPSTGSLGVWELASGRVVNAIDLPGGGALRGEPNLVQWSPDGRELFVPVRGCTIGRFAAFGSRGGPLMSVGIGADWDPTPFAIAPDGSELCLSVPGVWDSRHLPLAVVSTREDQWIGEQGPGIRWLGDPVPRGSDNFPSCTRLTWFEDGRIGMSAGYVVDAASGEVVWDARDAITEAWFSPSGAWFVANGPAGVVLGDGRTGERVRDLDVDGLSRVCWSRAHAARFAAVSSGGVLIGEPDTQIGKVEVAVLGIGPLRDTCPAAFDPRGERLVVLTRAHTLAVHDVAGARITETEPIGVDTCGVEWGGSVDTDRADVLVALGPDVVDFYRVSGERTSQHHLRPPPGYVDNNRQVYPARPPGAGLGGAHACRTPDPAIHAWRWILTGESGTEVMCAPDDVATLDQHLVVSLGGELGWPFRWAEETDVVRVVSAAREVKDKALEKLEGMARSRRFEDRERDLDAGYETRELEEKVRATFGFTEVRVPTRPVDWYHAPDPRAPSADAPDIEGLEGQPVLFALRRAPREVELATLLGMDGDQLALQVSYLPGGWRRVPPADVLWLGRARCITPQS